MKTQIWAHRGASGYAPENTMEAFMLAMEQKADGVELDVQLTKDGKLAVIHDETIERVTDGTGCVKDYTLEELKAFRANRTHPEFKDAVIPELSEVLKLLKDSGMMVNIELKTGIFRYKGIEKKVLLLVNQMGMDEQVIYSSFNHKSIKKIKAQNPGAKTGILYSDGWLDVPSYARKMGVDAIHPPVYQLRSKKLVQNARDMNLCIHAWTVNDEETIRYLADKNINAVITNYPDVARRIVNQKG